MADFEYFEDGRGAAAPDGYGAEAAGAVAQGGSRFGTALNWTGAIVSLGLVVGMGVWAVQLTLRDVSGVPVIQALEGPMRIAPEDPGGTQADHQGLAVNRLAEGAEAEPVPDQVVLAPPPVDLDAVSLPAPEVAQPRVVTPEEVNTETQALIDRLIARADPLGPVADPAPTEPSGQDTAATTPDPAEADAPAPVAETPSIAIIPSSVPGVARSLIPTTRPASIQTRADAAAVSEAPAAEGEGELVSTSSSTPSNGLELDAGSLAAGTRLVQLGAFDTPDLARAQWDTLTSQFPDFFTGRARVIEQASSGGSNFYRLRAHGFEDLAASRRFCSVLVAERAPCIPVTVR